MLCLAEQSSTCFPAQISVSQRMSRVSENRRGILLPDYPDLAREAVGARFAVSLCRSYGANQKSE